MTDEDLKKLVESNAKAIQALADSVAQEREENRRYRREMFGWMSRLAAAQSEFYEVQADYLYHVERIDDRLAEILDRLTPKNQPEE